jgi:hypothetical protein
MLSYVESGVFVRTWAAERYVINGERIDGEFLSSGDLLQFAEIVFRVGSSRADTTKTIAGDSSDRARSHQFDRLMSDRRSYTLPADRCIHDLRVEGSPGRSQLFGDYAALDVSAAAVLGWSRACRMMQPKAWCATAGQPVLRQRAPDGNAGAGGGIRCVTARGANGASVRNSRKRR